MKQSGENIKAGQRTTSNKRTCLLVLGMHRSGTSALTRVLNIAGAALPTMLMGVNKANKKGHWESNTLVQYHDEILNELGSSWHDWQSLDLSSLSAKRRLEITQKIAGIIASEFSQAPLFVVKDPRICRFAPLFIEAMNEAGIDVRTILPFRNPLEVCESLEKRDGLKRTNAALLWLRHVLDAERASRELNRAFVAYNHLLEDWKSTYNKISDRLELEGMYTIDEIGPQVSDFLSNELRHHTRKTGDVLLDPVLGDWADAIYESLLVLEHNPGSKKAMAKLDEISGEFDRASPILHRLCSEGHKECGKEIQELLRPGSDEMLSLKAELFLSEERRQAIDSSIFWRITSPLQALIRKQKSSNLLSSNKSVDLFKNYHSINPVNLLQYSDYHYKSLTENPQIIINSNYTLLPNWYVVKISINGENSGNPVLYFDCDSIFSEISCVELIKSVRKNTYKAVFRLPYKISRLRLDPVDCKCEFVLSELQIRKLGKLHVVSILFRHALRLAYTNPKRAFFNFFDYVQRLKDPGFLKLQTPYSHASQELQYKRWIKNYDYEWRQDRLVLKTQIEKLGIKPTISVLVPVYNTPEELLNEMIQSVVDQVYPHWELCLADDNSSKNHVRRNLQKWEAQDDRIKVVYRRKNGHISRATNSAFKISTGEWIALLDHDDLLRENALAEVVFEINRHPDLEIVYSDEDKLDSNGQRYDPYFKPDFSRELFRSQNYLNHLTVHKAKNIKLVSGWRHEYVGSQDYDLNLRIFELVDEKNIRHIPKILYHWRAVAGSTASSNSEKSYSYSAGKRALVDHVKRIGLDATVETPKNLPFYRVRLNPPKPEPLVSLIVPTRDGLKFLRDCIESIYHKTTYKNFEIIIVDNNSQDPATLTYLNQLTEHKNLSVLRYPHAFNYSAINNFAVKKANGSIIGLINSDIKVISPDWLTEMVSWATQPEIGCVGAKLYYENDTIQHAGVILGVVGVAGHPHRHRQKTDSGYFGRLVLLQNLSAVTAACLVVRKCVYEKVGGLNEKDLPVAYNDVDLCLKVREAGFRNLFTPYAELYHLESVSRGKDDNLEKQARFSREIDYMRRTWGDALAIDPYYSPHLTRDREDFSLRI